MSSNAIRVQLPGGELYAPALHEAAAKIGARSGLPKRTTKALHDLVVACVAVMNSGNSTMITLEVEVHEDSIEAKVTGKACSAPTKKLIKAADKLAAKRASSFEIRSTKTAHIIDFVV